MTDLINMVSGVLAVPGYNKLVRGDLLGAVQEPYLVTMGFWFYAIIMGTVMIALYLKSGQIALPMTLGLIALGIIIQYMPAEVIGVSYIISAVAITAILYRVFHG